MNFFYKLFSIILLGCSISCIDLYSQIKINESFEDVVFPPDGWSIYSSSSAEGQWAKTNRKVNIGSGCAVSNFSSSISSNYLITKRFIPTIGDSLVFCFRQNFWNTYKDTFKVLVSTIDSNVASMTNVLLNINDASSYPSYLSYSRFALSLNAYAGQTIWVAFKHTNLDGDNIRLDEIQVGKTLLNEVGVTDNIFPKGNLGDCSLKQFIPNAIIKNFGSDNIVTPFNITYSITGPVSYTSTKSDTLSAGCSKTIYFDSLNNINIPGTYFVKIFTSLPGDINISNDTLYTSFTLSPVNYGGGTELNGNYYFANSSECSSEALSHPEFCWRDTLSSHNLILNGAVITEELLTGNIDNGFFSLGNILPEGKKIKFFNNEYDSIFVSTNGIIGLKKNNVLLSKDPGQINDFMSQSLPALAPLWIDLDFENTFSNQNRLSYKVTQNQLIVTFDKAPLKTGNSQDFVSFQIIFEIGDSLQSNSNIVLQYNELNTGSGFINKYYNNSLPPHFIGMKNISGANYLTYRYKDTANVVSGGSVFNSSFAIQFGNQEDKLDSKNYNLNIRVLLEAISPRQDTITVSLADADNPSLIVESRKIFLNTNGRGTGKFTLADNTSKYYLIIQHRNSIQTWSKLNGESFNSYNLNYDFSLNTSMAFGNNMKIVNSQSYIYSGDVNQDATIDCADISVVENFAEISYSGYGASDLNGDGITDGSDVSSIENNIQEGIHRLIP